MQSSGEEERGREQGEEEDETLESNTPLSRADVLPSIPLKQINGVSHRLVFLAKPTLCFEIAADCSRSTNQRSAS